MDILIISLLNSKHFEEEKYKETPMSLLSKHFKMRYIGHFISNLKKLDLRRIDLIKNDLIEKICKA